MPMRCNNFKKYLLGFLASAIGLLLIPQMAQAATYYVDGASLGGACNNSNNGTALTTPWCTISTAASTASAGDTIFIRGATYRETVTPTNSGSSGSPIIYKKYGSETPVVSGADLLTPWSSLGKVEPAGVFTTGFETGDFADFTSTTVDSGVGLTVSGSVISSGDYAAVATYNGTGRNARMNTNITAANDVYARMYFRIASGYSLIQKDTNQVIMYLRADTSTNRLRISLRQNNSNLFYLFAETMTPSQTTIYNGSVSAGEIQADTWYYLEARYKGGDASTGGAQIWLNGTSKGSNYTMNTSTLQVGRLEVGGSTSGTAVPANGSMMYIDAIKADTAPVGAFAPLGDVNVYQTTGVNWTARQLFENGTSLGQPQANLLAVNSAGEWYLDSGAQTLYVWTSDSTNPNAKTMEASRRTNVFDLSSKSYITLDGLTVQYSNSNGSSGAGILGSGSTNLTIQNVTTQDNYGAGVYLKNSTSNVVTNNNVLRNQRQFGGGIRLENGSSNNTISSNTITGTGQTGGSGIFFCGDSGCGSNGNNSNIVRSNIISNVQDTCLYFDTNNDSNTVERNICFDSYKDYNDAAKGGNGYHFSLGSDNNLIMNNLVYNVQRHGISIRDGNTGNMIYNNTTYNTGTTSGNGIDIQGNNTGTIVKNNIAHTGATSALNIDAGSSDTISDYNLLYSPTGIVGKWSGSTHSSLEAYKTASGQDAHSISADPLFTNAAGGDFSLRASSPAIDMGTLITAVTEDKDGNTRPLQCSYDIGYYEVPGACVPTPTPTSGTPSNNSSSDAPVSSTSPRECTNAKPSQAPDLFQIDRTKDKAILYFTPAGNNVSSYIVMYGPSVNNYIYGAEFGGNSQGVQKIEIGSLHPSKQYVFTVRGGNGCATGEWSNALTAKASAYGTTKIYKNMPARVYNSTKNSRIIKTPTPTPKRKLSQKK